jgi:hypothetical protein
MDACRSVPPVILILFLLPPLPFYRLPPPKLFSLLLLLFRIILLHHVFIDDFIDGRLNSDKPLVVWLAPKPTSSGDIVVPWTVFMAIRRPGICNVEVKRALEKQGVIISIGSACNTDSDKASHVVYALDLPTELKAGVLRISFGYDTKKEDVLYTADLITNIILR